MRSRIIVMVLVFAIAGLLVGLAPEETPVKAQNKEPPELVLTSRVYDISAMLLEIPQYHFAYLMDPQYDGYYYYDRGRRSIFDDDDDETEGTELLQQLIERMVRSSEAWESLGGRAIIEIYSASGLMIVSQTLEGHKQVAKVLERFEGRKTRTVMLHIRAAQLDEEFVDQQIASGEFAARTAEQKAALGKAIRKTHAQTLLSGASGQHLSNNSGTAASFINNLEPVVAEHAVAWDPTAGYLLDGLAVHVEPTLISNGGRLQLNYRFTYARRTGMRKADLQAATGKARATGPLDLPEFVCDQRSGTVVLQLNTPTIITGGTVPENLISAKAEAGSKIQLYYIVTARLLGVSEETE